MAKKLLALLLTAGMAIGMLAGCGDTKDPAADDKSSVSEDEADDKEEESKEEVKKDEPPTNLTVVMYGEAMARNSVFWEEEFTDAILEAINCTIDVIYFPWGATDQLNTLLASGEPCMFMGPNSTHISNGYLAFMEEDHIREVAPNYIASRMAGGFGNSSYQGKVYGLPTGYMVYSNMYDDFWIREDWLQEVGLTVDNIKTHEDLLDAAEAVHKAKPEVAIVKDVKHFTLSFDALYSDNTAIIDIQFPSVITAYNILDEESDEVINWLKSDWCKELIKMTEMWKERDLIEERHVTDQAYFESQAQNSNCLLGFGNPSYVYAYNSDPEGSHPEAISAYLKLGDTPNFIAKDFDWQWGISAAAEEDADKYLALLDWTYASKDNYMFSMYGVEGVDWEWDDETETTYTKLVNDSMFYDWMYKTYYYSPIIPKAWQTQEDLDKYMAFDETAIQSKGMGFQFDNTSVQTEYTLIQAVLTEQAKPIYYGLGDYDKDWPGVIDALDKAGLDKYVAEYQAQFTEHMKSK